MLPSITVDPSTIWMVHGADTVEGASQAITSALEWMKPNATGPLRIYLSSRGIDALAKANAFPAEPRLAEVLKALGLEGVLSPKMLAASVSRFLARNDWVEDEVGLRDVLYQGTQITPDPTVVILDQELQGISVDAIGLAAVCAHENIRHSLYAFPRQSAPHSSVRVETRVDIVDLGEDNIRLEEGINLGIEILGSPAAWPTGLSSAQIWNSATCPEDLEVAIWLAATEIDQQARCGLKDFRVGTHFLESLGNSGAGGNGPFADSVRQKCAQTILLQSSLQPKPFLTSTDANASVRERERDKAKAWRLHVTKSHQALRLMYWELPCGQIEFATLGEKAEESIHEGAVIPPRSW